MVDVCIPIVKIVMFLVPGVGHCFVFGCCCQGVFVVIVVVSVCIGIVFLFNLVLFVSCVVVFVCSVCVVLFMLMLVF